MESFPDSLYQIIYRFIHDVSQFLYIQNRRENIKNYASYYRSILLFFHIIFLSFSSALFCFFMLFIAITALSLLSAQHLFVFLANSKNEGKSFTRRSACLRYYYKLASSKPARSAGDIVSSDTRVTEIDVMALSKLCSAESTA